MRARAEQRSVLAPRPASETPRRYTLWCSLGLEVGSVCGFDRGEDRSELESIRGLSSIDADLDDVDW